jgi:hypothetical protein
MCELDMFRVNDSLREVGYIPLSRLLNNACSMRPIAAAGIYITHNVIKVLIGICCIDKLGPRDWGFVQ